MKERVNVCGVPESEWIDGVCYRCGSRCQMSEYGIVSKRAYDYADRHFLLDQWGTFGRSIFVSNWSR